MQTLSTYYYCYSLLHLLLLLLFHPLLRLLFLPPSSSSSFSFSCFASFSNITNILIGPTVTTLHIPHSQQSPETRWVHPQHQPNLSVREKEGRLNVQSFWTVRTRKGQVNREDLATHLSSKKRFVTLSFVFPISLISTFVCVHISYCHHRHIATSKSRNQLSKLSGSTACKRMPQVDYYEISTPHPCSQKTTSTASVTPNKLVGPRPSSTLEDNLPKHVKLWHPERCMPSKVCVTKLVPFLD